jgi:dienelactone hydrolase
LGARTANIIAALRPERCKAMVSVSGYLIGSQEAGKMPLPYLIRITRALHVDGQAQPLMD